MTLFGYKLIKQHYYDDLVEVSSLCREEVVKISEELTLATDEKYRLLKQMADMEKDLMDRPILSDVQDVLTELRKRHPDKMLLEEEWTDFARGREAGYIELIEEIAALIAPETEQEEADDGEPRY